MRRQGDREEDRRKTGREMNLEKERMGGTRGHRAWPIAPAQGVCCGRSPPCAAAGLSHKASHMAALYPHSVRGRHNLGTLLIKGKATSPPDAGYARNGERVRRL